MDSRLEQPVKVSDSMVVTFSGMVIVLRLEQFAKAYAQMEVTLCGMVTASREVLFIKAPSPIV